MHFLGVKSLVLLHLGTQPSQCGLVEGDFWASWLKTWSFASSIQIRSELFLFRSGKRRPQESVGLSTLCEQTPKSHARQC